MTTLKTTRKSIAEIVSDFRLHGYSVDRGVFSEEELSLLQTETAGMISQDLRMPPDDYQVRDGRPWRIDFASDPQKLYSNDSIGVASMHPRILQVMRGLLGANFALINNMFTFKDSAGGAVVDRHRDDMPDEIRFALSHVVPSADVYLDYSTPASGCLYVVPGSSRINDVQHLVGRGMEDVSDMVPIEMEPGDVLFHDSLTVHGSQATKGSQNLRRIIYYTYSDPEHLLNDGLLATLPPPPRSWVAGILGQSEYWAKRRQEMYGDASYKIPEHWRTDVDRVGPVLRPDPTWITEEMRVDFGASFKELSAGKARDTGTIN